MGICNLDSCNRRHHAQEFARKGELPLANVVGDQSGMVDAVEAAWQHMQQEATQTCLIHQVQHELALDDGVTDPAGSRLMQALDAVIQRFGHGMVALASAGLSGDGRHWCMKQERRTPGYTTDWDGLALVRA